MSQLDVPAPPTKPPWFRRRVFIVDGFQARFAITQLLWLLLILSVLSTVLLGPLVLQLLDHRDTVDTDVARLADQFLLLHRLVWPLFASFLLLSGVVTVLMTHRVAGPLYRFRRVFADVGRGVLTMTVRTRDGDYLTREATELDAMVAALRERVTRAQSEAADVQELARRLLDRAASLPADELQVMIDRADRLRATLDEFDTTVKTAPAVSSVVSDATGGEPRASRRAASIAGFTLLELMLVVCVTGIIASIAVPMYTKALDAARMTRAIADVRSIDRTAQIYVMVHGCLPSTLADIEFVSVDPWGQPYVYHPIRAKGGKTKGSCMACTDVCINQNAARKDKSLHPVNSDFDAFSMGPDRKSTSALTAGPSKDDIIRGGNGSFFGLGRDF